MKEKNPSENFLPPLNQVKNKKNDTGQTIGKFTDSTQMTLL